MEGAKGSWEDAGVDVDAKLENFERAYQEALSRVIQFRHILPKGRRKFNPTILRR